MQNNKIAITIHSTYTTCFEVLFYKKMQEKIPVSAEIIFSAF